MTLEIRDGFLVETFPRSKLPVRKARILSSSPSGRTEGYRTITLNGQRYTMAFHFETGMRQGRAVAWPKGDS